MARDVGHTGAGQCKRPKVIAASRPTHTTPTAVRVVFPRSANGLATVNLALFSDIPDRPLHGAGATSAAYRLRECPPASQSTFDRIPAGVHAIEGVATCSILSRLKSRWSEKLV